MSVTQCFFTLAGGKQRWGDKDPATVRNKRLSLVVAGNELDMMNAKAAAAGISRTELIVRAVEKYEVEV